MKRDLDLIRKIVLAIEESPSGFAPKLSLGGYSDAQIGYHEYLLISAGYATGQETTNMGSEGPEAMIRSLTWAGHEFADAARDDSRWNRALGMVKDKSGTITLELLKQLLSTLMRNALGLP
ncbi:MAG TPA: DUF2513 domain-containing protein [Thermoanaerobaculaceae bacterium]|nr:DUF2513 domain-containing protein [Thermoanaerobaculaceae bacterium]